MLEFFLIFVIIIFMLTYRKNNGENVYKYIVTNSKNVFNKYTPYSFKVVRDKAKELGQEFTTKQYVRQILLFATIAGVIGYMYFYSLIVALVYGLIAISFIPFLAYLRCKRIYSDFVFEQIQVYTTNVIMEFNTTRSFVKSLEGVRDSGVLEDPILSDIKEMINLSYSSGNIEDSINYFNNKYNYYIVKNMHQLFLQITNEGAKDSGEALEVMLQDIDMLVENVYRDRMDRQNFHKKFIIFGLALYLLMMLMQILLGNESYIKMIELWYVQILLHLVVLINSYFLISGEKYYNEDVGVE